MPATVVGVARGRGRRNIGTNAEDAKELLKQAAIRCVERHGVLKTTMDDIAREAGVSRPSVYRYFQDRDDILLTVFAERSRALLVRAHRYMAKQPSFKDALVEGLLYIADHGRRDPFARHLITADDARFTQGLIVATGTARDSAKEFWQPVFEQAADDGELAEGLDEDLAYRWLADVGLLLMAHLDRGDETVEQLRAQLQAFVLPAFAAPKCAAVSGPGSVINP